MLAVSIARPAFDAQYDAQPGPATQAFVDATVTTAPRRASRCGSAARATRNAPVRLMRSTASHASGESSPTGAEAPTP